MNGTDWIALCILACFLLVGKRKNERHRRQRVNVVILLFLGLYASTFTLFPYPLSYVTGKRIMPFRSYNLYSVPAPTRYYCARPFMVSSQGKEYPIDFRLWYPFVPRYFNILLEKTLDSDAQTQHRTGAVLLKKVRAGLDNYHTNGRFIEPSARLLGNLHYPAHQSHAIVWRPGMKLPKSKDIVKIRVYRFEWETINTKTNAARFQKTLCYEFPS